MFVFGMAVSVEDHLVRPPCRQADGQRDGIAARGMVAAFVAVAGAVAVKDIFMPDIFADHSTADGKAQFQHGIVAEKRNADGCGNDGEDTAGQVFDGKPKAARRQAAQIE